MGRIKSALVKRTANQLVKQKPADTFSSDFEHNKKLLGNTMPSKKMRNKIAGQITRTVRQKENQNA